MPEVDVEILHETQSLCPVCLRRLDARYVRRGQSILLERTCPEHGTFAVDIWHERTEEDVTPPRFDGWSRPKTPSYPREPRTAVRHGCPYDCGLCPAHAQHTCTGLVEVTLRCNMACPICYAAAGGAVPDDPSPETVAFQLDSLRRASPGCNVQLSGGEPTVRDDLPAIIRMARERGFGLLQVNSNGLRLGLEAGYARTLREAGLDSVYLQWDSPDLEGCLPLRGTVALPDGLDLLAVKRRAVEQCTAAGLGVVLVATVARGVNDDRLGALLRLALELARQAAEEGEVPVGAVIVRDGEVIATGRNRRETARHALAHAEIEAIAGACARLGGWRLSGCDLYVTLEPCPMCAGAIINARLSRVVQGTADPKAGSCGSVVDLFALPYNHRPVLVTGVLEEECAAELTGFFQRLRRERDGKKRTGPWNEQKKR